MQQSCKEQKLQNVALSCRVQLPKTLSSHFSRKHVSIPHGCKDMLESERRVSDEVSGGNVVQWHFSHCRIWLKGINLIFHFKYCTDLRWFNDILLLVN